MSSCFTEGKCYCTRPAAGQKLLACPPNLHQVWLRNWQRQCLVDLMKIQGREHVVKGTGKKLSKGIDAIWRTSLEDCRDSLHLAMDTHLIECQRRCLAFHPQALADSPSVDATWQLLLTQTHLWPGPCAPGCTLSPVAGLTAVRLLCKGHTLSVVHNTLGVLTIKCYTVNRASLGASTTGSWAGSPFPCFPPVDHRIKQTNNGPTKWHRGQCRVHVAVRQGKYLLCRTESETSSYFTKRCPAWLAMQSMSSTPKANDQLQNTCHSGNAELSLRGSFISMAFGFLTSAKILCLEWNTKEEETINK